MLRHFKNVAVSGQFVLVGPVVWNVRKTAISMRLANKISFVSGVTSSIVSMIIWLVEELNTAQLSTCAELPVSYELAGPFTNWPGQIS